MRRTVAIAFGIGIAGLLGMLLLSVAVHVAVVPSYLGAWLVLLALPMGALPLVMAREAIGFDGPSPLTPPLRALLILMPLAALLAVPLLFRLPGLYPVLATRPAGLPGVWMSPAFFTMRMIVFILVWTALSLTFARPVSRGRRGLACFGLMLHVLMGTLAAVDWAMAVEPRFYSSAFGILFLFGQSGMAAALATVLVRPTPSRPVALVLSLLLGLWIFLQFTQYLVIWSANLPAEVLWYQHRSAGLGWTAESVAALLCLLALGILLPRTSAARPGLVAMAAGALVLLHGFEMLWLVTPAFRSHFSITLADMLGLVGLGGLGVGAALLLAPRRARQAGAAS